MASTILSKAKKSMEFLKDLTFELDGIQTALSVYDWVNCYALYRLMNSGGKSLAIMDPAGDTAGLFMVSAAALAAYEQDLNDSSARLRHNLKPGDLVKVQGCLGRFLGEQEVYGEQKLKVKFADMEYYLPVLNIWKLSKYYGNATRLHKYKKKKETGKKARNTLAEIFGITRDQQDVVQKTRVLVVEKKATVMKYYKNLKINNSPFSTLFPAAYFPGADNYERIGRDSLQREPIVCFASSLGVARKLLDRYGSSVALMLINSSVTKNLSYGEIELIQHEKLPFIVLLQPGHYEAAKTLNSMSIEVCKWDKSCFKELNAELEVEDLRKHPFIKHRLTVRNLATHKREKEVVDPGYEFKKIREELLGRLEGIREGLRESNTTLTFLNLAYGILFYVQNLLCPVSFLQECAPARSTPDEKINTLSDMIPSLYTYMKQPELITELQSLPGELHKLISCFSDYNPKGDQLINILRAFEGRTGVVVRGSRDRLLLKKWLRTIHSIDVPDVLLPRELNETFPYKNLIIPGWFRELKGGPLYPGKAQRHIHLLYDFEDRYLQGHLKYLDSIQNRARSLLDVFSKKDTDNHKQEVEVSDSHDLTEVMSDISLKFARNHGYATAENNNNYSKGSTEPARYVSFEEDYYAYLTDRFRAHVISREEETVKLVYGKDLREGDELVFSIHSKGDVFEELIRRIELSNYEVHKMVRKAALWQRALRDYMTSHSPQFFCQELNNYGFSRVAATVENWIRDDARIAPGDYQIIDAIAEITGDQVLLKQKDEVKEACRFVRNLHIRLGKFLARKIIASVFDSEDDVSSELGFPELSDNLSEYAMLLTISNISNAKIDVPVNQINRLIERY